MSQKISYKDALMENLDKNFEVSKKNIMPQYSRKDIRKMCTSGNLDQLSKVPLKLFTEETKNFLLKNMKEKILEIEMWKCEDQNQLSGKLEEFDLRISGIETCINYVNSLV